MSEETTVNTDSVPQVPAETAEKPKLSKAKKIIIGVVVFIGLVIAIAFYATSGVSQTSNAFVDDILKNNSSAAYELFSAEAKQTVTTEQFQQIVATMANVLDSEASKQSAEVESGTGQETKGTAVYEIKGSDGTYELTVNLIKENNEWRVLNFDNTRIK
jgi:hypothetical protein